MKILLRPLIYCILGVGLLLPATAVRAQDVQTEVKLMKVQIDQDKELVQKWTQAGNEHLAIVIAVGVLGALVVLLQRISSRKWCAITVAVIGFLISALTVIANSVFNADHRTLLRSAHAANEAVRSAEQFMSIYETTTDDGARKQVFMMIRNKLALVDDLKEQLSSGSIQTASAVDQAKRPWAQAFLPQLVTSAFAAKVYRPAWISQPPSQTGSVFRCVGVAASTSLSTAQKQSKANAVVMASRRLSISPALVERYARQVNSYLEFDPRTRQYRYYTLLELNKAWLGLGH